MATPRRSIVGLVAAPFLALAALPSAAETRSSDPIADATADATATPATLDEGQGTAEPGTRLDGLRPGSPVFGVPFDPADLLGKIVVVEIGGS